MDQDLIEEEIRITLNELKDIEDTISFIQKNTSVFSLPGGTMSCRYTIRNVIRTKTINIKKDIVLECLLILQENKRKYLDKLLKEV